MGALPKEQLLEKFLAWSRVENDIRAAALVGSAARGDHPADEWSDHDLIVVANDPHFYFASNDWLANLGSPWFIFVERTPSGEPIEQRVLYEGGFDFDFIIVSSDNARGSFKEIPMVPEIMQRGMRVLLDKDGLLSTLPTLQAVAQTPQPPACQTFLEVVNDFWFHAAWTAKKLRRGEIWVAKNCCDVYLKNLLLRMMEWEARSTRGWETNTWFNGRFLEEWALPETLMELRRAFAAYEPEDVWRGLDATMKMFSRMATRLADRLGYPYPAQNAGHVSQWVSQVHP